MNFKSIVRQEMARTKVLSCYVDNWLASSPSESLRIKRCGRLVYYNSQAPAVDGVAQKESYISSKPNSRVLRLAQKKMCRKLAPKLRKNLKALNNFLQSYDFDWADLECLRPEAQALADPLFVTQSSRASTWGSFHPQSNQFHPERLVYETKAGDFVRSKSELIIANLLHDYGVLYRYEAVLRVGGRAIYPDFTIRHPKDGRLVYWEHFGMMDEPDYCAEFIAKKQLYNESGFFEGVNLIFTFESSSVPLSQKDIKREISRLCED